MPGSAAAYPSPILPPLRAAANGDRLSDVRLGNHAEAQLPLLGHTRSRPSGSRRPDTTQAESPARARGGDGGEIEPLVGDVIDLPDSAVIASAAGGADPTAGEITIDSKVLVIPQQLDPGQRAGWLRWPGKDRRRQHPVPGGDFEALLARGDISATRGDPTRAGTIAVNAPEVHLSGGLVVVKALFSMRPSCASASLRDATWMPAASSVWAAAACSQVPMDRSPARR